MPRADFFPLRADSAEDERALMEIYVLICAEKTRHSPGRSSPRAVKDKRCKWRKKRNGEKSIRLNFEIELVLK